MAQLAISIWLFVMAVIALALTNAADADEYSCRSAVSSYNLALESASTALRRYANCLSVSEGQDDCSVQFSTLRRRQFDFEFSVQNYQSECEEY